MRLPDWPYGRERRQRHGIWRGVRGARQVHAKGRALLKLLRKRLLLARGLLGAIAARDFAETLRGAASRAVPSASGNIRRRGGAVCRIERGRRLRIWRGRIFLAGFDCGAIARSQNVCTFQIVVRVNVALPGSHTGRL
jgi:hypothetical protein